MCMIRTKKPIYMLFALTSPKKVALKILKMPYNYKKHKVRIIRIMRTVHNLCITHNIIFFLICNRLKKYKNFPYMARDTHTHTPFPTLMIHCVNNFSLIYFPISKLLHLLIIRQSTYN